MNVSARTFSLMLVAFASSQAMAQPAPPLSPIQIVGVPVHVLAQSKAGAPAVPLSASQRPHDVNHPRTSHPFRPRPQPVTSTTSQGGIQFEEQVSQAPIVITLNKMDDCSSNICYYFDTNGNRRVELYSSKYNILNSRGVTISTVGLSTEDQASLKNKIGLVSGQCPASIVVSRSTLRIERSINSCRPRPGINTMTLVRIDDCGSNFCYLFEEGKQSKSFVLRTNSPTYKVSTASGDYDEKVLSPGQYERLRIYTKSVSPTCPIRIDFEGETGTILKVKLGCDPLAVIDTTERMG